MLNPFQKIVWKYGSDSIFELGQRRHYLNILVTNQPFVNFSTLINLPAIKPMSKKYQNKASKYSWQLCADIAIWSFWGCLRNFVSCIFKTLPPLHLLNLPKFFGFVKNHDESGKQQSIVK